MLIPHKSEDFSFRAFESLMVFRGTNHVYKSSKYFLNDLLIDGWGLENDDYFPLKNRL